MGLFDFDDPGLLGQMEEHGYMTTNEGLVGKVARELNKSPNQIIETDEFRDACVRAGVDPDSFTQKDLESLQRKLK